MKKAMRWKSVLMTAITQDLTLTAQRLILIYYAHITLANVIF